MSSKPIIKQMSSTWFRPAFQAAIECLRYDDLQWVNAKECWVRGDMRSKN